MPTIHFSKILQIDLALNMSGIAKKLSIENIGTIVLELHVDGQSKMNQRFSYHDFYRFYLFYLNILHITYVHIVIKGKRYGH